MVVLATSGEIFTKQSIITMKRKEKKERYIECDATTDPWGVGKTMDLTASEAFNLNQILKRDGKNFRWVTYSDYSKTGQD